MKKIVGIIARPDKTIDNNDAFIVNKHVISMLNEYDVIPLVIAPPGKYEYNDINVKISDSELNDMLSLVNLCDGILFQGGDDFYEFDIDIVKYLYQKNIPTLGICLGMQTLGYTFNGHTTNVSNHKGVTHEIIINKDSLLYKIVGKEKIIVNSRHKECLSDTNLFKGAYSLDNVIEEIEDSNKKCFLGVQWHPEDILNEDEKKIIEYFINSL